MIESLTAQLVEIIRGLGYFGIFIGLLLESTVFPLPSELIMIPAGYLAVKGDMNLWVAAICGTLGSLAGSLINYYCSITLGYSLIRKYGKYALISERNFDRICDFFKKHGEISTFVGRLLPVIRHLISIPAGFARMNIWKFCFFTTIGSFIWMLVLVYIGWFVGSNPDMIHQYLAKTQVILAITLFTLIAIYIIWHRFWRPSGA